MESSHEDLASNQARAFNPSQPIHDPRDVRHLERVAVHLRMRKGLGTMTTETLPGLGLTASPMTLDDDYDQHAVRAIQRVKLTFIEDRDKLREVIGGGGTHLEMRAATDAYRVIEETIRGLELAIDRVLGNDVKDEEA